MTVLAAVMMAASISEATLLRMGAMPVAPKIDNVISREEECAASTQYGLVSHDNGLMSKRYAVAHVGYTDYPIDFETLDLGAVVPSEGEYLWISVGPKWGQGLRAAQGTVERVC